MFNTTMPRKAAEFWWNLPIDGRDTTKKFVADPNVAYYEKKFPHDKWEVVTWADIHKKRTERININISHKRNFIKTVQPAIIWVFYNENFLFHGWYVKIRTLKNSFYLNWKTYDRNIIERAMSLYNCGIIPSAEFENQWFESFAKTYHTNSFGGRKKQGTAFCYAVFNDHGNLIDLLPPKKPLSP